MGLTGMMDAPPNVQEAMEQSASLYGAGKYREAAGLLQKVIRADPRNAAAHHLLGIVVHKAGNNLDKAIEIVTRAVRLSPKDGQYATNLTELLRLAKRLDEAIAMGKKAVSLAPRSAAAHSNLGIAFYDAKDLKAAEESQKLAIAIEPTNANALNNLGSIRRLLRDLDGAAEYYRKVLQLHPSHADSENNLGSVLIDMERAAEARDVLEKLTQRQPQFAEAQKNLGRALLMLGELDKAESALRRALQANPDFAEAHLELSALLQDRNNADLAMDEALKALALAPELPAALIQAGRCYAELGDVPNALASYEKAIAIDPDNAQAKLARGHIRMEAGDMDGARADFEDVRAKSREYDFAPVVALVSLDKITPDSPLLASLEKHHENIGAMNPRRQITLHYALGKAYDDLKRADDAFDHFAKAAALKRSTIKYDADAYDAKIDAIRAAFSPEAIQRMRDFGIASQQPIFVLGMPRSGTTLTESILSNHPDVFGAGELADMHRIFRFGSGQENSPAAFTAMPGDELRARAYRYVENLNARAPGKPRITDKMPSNFEFIGLIHALMPNAKIIHVSRHPLDTCLSQFMRHFAHSQYQSYDLTELGRFYSAYARLMEHWNAVLPSNAFYTIRYEELVDDIEQQARKMLDYCGLPWDEACLSFHEAKRRVRTASVTQVRQPIYRSSLAKWKAYEPHLGALKAAIGKYLDEDSKTA